MSINIWVIHTAKFFKKYYKLSFHLTAMPKKNILRKKILRTGKKIVYDEWQLKFLNLKKGDKILCTGRQVGKSVICGKDAGDYAIENPETEPIVMIAPTERQSQALFNKTLNYLVENFPESIAGGLNKPTKEKITLTTGVEIYCLPVGQSGLGIRFITIGRLYVDEASRVPEDVWEAITPALLTTGGDTILLSTPFGAEGEFYRTFINEDKAYDSFTRFSIDSEKVIRERPISESWTEERREKAIRKLEQAKKRMSERQYAQEYLGKFMEGLHRWFLDKVIESACILKKKETILPNRDYFMGCDIAHMGEDEGTIEILEKKRDGKIEQVENIITKKTLTTETEDNIVRADLRYDCRKIGIDAGSGTMGTFIVEHLLRIPSIRKKIVPINNAKRVIDRDGSSVKLMKIDLYENLLALMEQGIIKLLDDDEVIDSLSSVQYEYVIKEGEQTKLRIFGNYTHIAEGLIRAAWLANQKSLNLSISYI
jgi:hypothetical protein